jgi:response regulator of citrate/malate metabolism
MHPILIADVPSMDARYWAALAGWSLAFTRTMEEARATLAAQRCAAVVIGVYFDDSQMFDLVRAIRADEFQNEVPIVCVRGTPGYTAVSTSTLESALKVLAADAFVDLLHFAQEESGNAALRAAVQRYLKA